ncbi:MAG TPA: response regulator transcription factor [Nitrospira sp.]|nr:response regulator transcription factor [Nitrospira sp.]
MNRTPSRKVWVTIVDDDPFVRQSLTSLLDGDEIGVIAACGDANECLASISRSAPNVLIIDLLMKGDPNAGINLISQVTEMNNTIACMILTAYDLEGRLLIDALKRGARGYFSKNDISGNDLPDMVRKLASGGWAIDPQFKVKGEERLLPDSDDDPGPILVNTKEPVLSYRQRQCLKLVLEGLSRKEIARRLGLSTNTVKTHLQNACAKFTPEMNPPQLAAYAAIKGMLENTTV